MSIAPQSRDRRDDIVIVGGGVAGLACALLLARHPAIRRQGLGITLLEQHPPEQPGGDIGPRVFALSPASVNILGNAGAWQNLPPDRKAPYRRMVVWESGGSPGGPGSIVFDAAEAGMPALGHIVEHDVVRWALWASAGLEPAIRFVTGTAPTGLKVTSEGVRIHLVTGDSLDCRLVIGADGARSWVREQLGLATRHRDYGQRAIVAHLAGAEPHRDTAFQCFLPGGPVALLPLGDGRSSLVWSCSDAEAGELLAASDAEFEARLTAVAGPARGPLTLTTRRVAFPLAASHTRRYTGARFALIGDAAHQVHPLAGQGINLGLLDAAALAETLGEHTARTGRGDPGDVMALRRYERWRKGDNLLTLGAMEALHRLFTSPWPGLRRLGGMGMGQVDRLPALKRILADHALGRGGDLPGSARAWPGTPGT